METEVRITHLLPRELRERRRARSVAWLPVGTLEWHGPHLPLSVDGAISEGVAVEAAREIGGVAFPPMYYGDHRGLLTDVVHTPGWVAAPHIEVDHREGIYAQLGASQDRGVANAVRDHAAGAHEQHVALLLRAFWMIRAYGFARVVAIIGHGPNGVPTFAAADTFNAAQSACLVIPAGVHHLVHEMDHAGRYETSLMMALHPALVDVERAQDGAPRNAAGELEPLGVSGPGPASATAEHGREIVATYLERVRELLGELDDLDPQAAGADEDGTQPDWPDPSTTDERLWAATHTWS
jgi:creatinine amidohydrolase